MKKLLLLLVVVIIVFLHSLTFADIITVSGKGTSSTNLFEFNEGLLVFDMKLSTTKTYESFYISLYDSYGNYVYSLYIETFRQARFRHCFKRDQNKLCWRIPS